MKKMFTFLVATGLFTVAFAQDRYDQRQQQPNNVYQNNVVRDDHHFDNRFINRERDEQIARINHDFDFKVNAINHRWFMSREKKNWEIHNLDVQRAQQVGEVYARFNGRDAFHQNGFAQNRHW